LRTFIAIDLDPEIKKTLIQLIKELDLGNRSIKWVTEQGMHLTLKFLGEIGRERVAGIEDVLRRISEKYNSFFLKFKGTGSFPPGKKAPRVLWVDIEEEESLETLQSELEAELEKLGFPKEERRFHPHLTLGRVKVPSGLGQTLSLLEKHKDQTFGEMKVKKITFFESTLHPTGAEYSILSEFGLR
jgi:2'-5' RNA ligase